MDKHGKLTAKWTFKRAGGAGFRAIAKLLQHLVSVSNEYDHHADVSFGDNTITISYITHSAGGITELDIHCARLIGEIADECVQKNERAAEIFAKKKATKAAATKAAAKPKRKNAARKRR